MPRWAEVVILLVVAFMAVIAILVFARVRHRESEELQRQTDLTLAQSQTIPDLPRDLLDVGPVAPRRPSGDRVAALPPENATESVVLPPVTRPTAAADAGATAAADAAAMERPFVLTDIIATPSDDAAPPVAEGDGLSALDDALAPGDTLDDAAEGDADDGDVGDTNAAAADATARAIAARDPNVVEAGSPAELAVLRDAERTLNTLYAYRLRADIPKAIVQAEADRLTALLGRLPESTRVAVEAALEDGYRRLARDGNGPLTATPGAVGSKALGLRDAELGRGEADDLRSFAERIRAIERAAGAPAPATPSSAYPTPSPTGSLPSAPSSGLGAPPTPPPTAPTAPSVLPAAAPSSLDGRLD